MRSQKIDITKFRNRLANGSTPAPVANVIIVCLAKGAGAVREITGACDLRHKALRPLVLWRLVHSQGRDSVIQGGGIDHQMAALRKHIFDLVEA